MLPQWDFMFANPQTDECVEEERETGLLSIPQGLLDLSLPMNVDDWYVNLGMER